jgi:putative acyl-CoA dehydrogenase
LQLPACGTIRKKQGSSDLRQTQTTATKNWDGTYSLVGHNWFFSVPHSGVFLTLARTEEGVSCFVVAGLLPDGTRNRPRIQRLKVSLHISLASPATAFVKGSR